MLRQTARGKYRNGIRDSRKFGRILFVIVCAQIERAQTAPKCIQAKVEHCFGWIRLSVCRCFCFLQFVVIRLRCAICTNRNGTGADRTGRRAVRHLRRRQRRSRCSDTATIARRTSAQTVARGRAVAHTSLMYPVVLSNGKSVEQRGRA